MALLPNLFMPALANNSDALLQTGLGLLSGKTANEQAAMGLQGFTQARKQNKTVDWLRKNDPELAAAVEQGMLGAGDAFKMFYSKKLEAEKPVSPLEINGKLVDPTTYQVIADFSTPPKPEDPYKVVGGSMYDKSTGEWITPPPNPQDQRKVDQQSLGNEMDVLKTYRAEDDVKSYKDMRNSYQRMRASASRGDAQGDMGLVYSYMKMLDPGSVVREGEFATAENTGGVDESIRNSYNKLLNGERLTPEQRQAFHDAGYEYYQKASENIADENSSYGQMAEQYGIPKERFLVEPQAFEPLTIADMAVGQEKTSPSGKIRRTR